MQDTCCRRTKARTSGSSGQMGTSKRLPRPTGVSQRHEDQRAEPVVGDDVREDVLGNRLFESGVPEGSGYWDRRDPEKGDQSCPSGLPGGCHDSDAKLRRTSPVSTETLLS